MITHDPVDIVSIGGGMTATLIAGLTLPDTSLRMVSIEQGPAQWTYPDFQHNHDSLEYNNRFKMMQDLSRVSWTWRPNATSPALPMRQYGSFNPGAGLGGAMVHWTGLTWRFLPTDFNYRTHHEERYGANRIPDEMTVQDWPMSYDEMERHYDAFEWDVGVSGQAGNLGGQILPGGNPFEGQRQRGYPNPPLAPSSFGKLFEETTNDMGYHPFPTPAGILSRGWTDRFGNTRAGCLYCGFCTRYGCEVDAKSSPLTTWLPVALDTGRYEVRTNSVVMSIETDSDGMATGLRYINAEGEEHFQPAELIISSAYTLENIRNLLLARSDEHPDGIGNDRGMVGRNYTYQIAQEPATGLWEGKRFNFFMGNGCTIPQIYDFSGDNFDHSDLDFIGGGRMAPTEGQREPVGSAQVIADPFTERRWGDDWKRTLGNHWDSIGGIFIEGESPAYAGNFCDLDSRYTDHWGRPLLRITFDWRDNERNLFRYLGERAGEILREMNPDRMNVDVDLAPYRYDDYQSTHATGGVIMGTDPGNSVTNSYGQVWDTPNVFVTGAALFPQNPGANPTGTVGALAYRTAEAIRDRYFQNPRQLLE